MVMTSTSQAPKSSPQPSDFEHPLLADPERLENILDIMYAMIQKVLFPSAYLHSSAYVS